MWSKKMLILGLIWLKYDRLVTMKAAGAVDMLYQGLETK